jgi:hypothetical protein
VAGTSLLALIDDIASILDDVATLTKVATKKTAGVLGDDLALNAQQVSGVNADRELPVVWGVAKGSMVNKLILVPAALVISAFAPWAVTPLLMLGGAFLCYEGFEKVAEKLWYRDAAAVQQGGHRAAVADEAVDLVALEKDKIRGAIRTDFILSAEIIVIALGTVASQPFTTRLTVLAAIGALMTVGVYGLVAGIVKLDDLGLHLAGRSGSASRALGRGILAAAPKLMKLLGIAGTAAMFLVGGSILLHGLPWLHHAVQALTAGTAGIAATLVGVIADGLTGVVAGGLMVAAPAAAKSLRRAPSTA